MMLSSPELFGVGALLTGWVRKAPFGGLCPDSGRSPPEAAGPTPSLPVSVFGPRLRDAAHVAEQRLLDLADDLERLRLLALPDVASEDHPGAARLHDRAGMREDGLV